MIERTPDWCGQQLVRAFMVLDRQARSALYDGCQTPASYEFDDAAQALGWLDAMRHVDDSMANTLREWASTVATGGSVSSVCFKLGLEPHVFFKMRAHGLRMIAEKYAVVAKPTEVAE